MCMQKPLNMMKGVSSLSSSFFDFSKTPLTEMNPTQILNCSNDHVYESDDFRMYAFKIKRCSKTRSHDWTECPFAHRGEKARRRDPRKINYSAIACPEFRNGECQRGESCEFAHGVFEFWLHPARYRTRACNAGLYCQRKVCFFAHTPEQLRSGNDYTFWVHRMDDGSGRGGDGAKENGSSLVENSDLLEGVKGLKIGDGGGEGERGFGWEVDGSDLPDIDWISELVS